MTNADEDVEQTIKRLTEENSELRNSKEQSEALIAKLQDSLAAAAEDDKLRDRQSRLLLVLSRENRILRRALIKKRAQVQEVQRELGVLDAIVKGIGPETGGCS
jgi:predicted RNase H-like nuclease (RuvC/YqgF family)